MMSSLPMKKWWANTWKKWRGTVLFFGFVIVPVKSVLADFNWVPTGSMNPTILEGDLVYVNKAAYDLRLPLTLKRVAEWGDPDRGDVVVFFSPDDGTRMVKRVIGLPGDSIELRHNVVWLNGQALTYAPLSEEAWRGLNEQLAALSNFVEEDLDGRCHPVMTTPAIAKARRNFAKVTIPEEHYFVMGDNRDNSLDSRHYGFVPRKQVVGEAKRVMVSFDIHDWLKPRLDRIGHPLP